MREAISDSDSVTKSFAQNHESNDPRAEPTTCDTREQLPSVPDAVEAMLREWYGGNTPAE